MSPYSKLNKQARELFMNLDIGTLFIPINATYCPAQSFFVNEISLKQFDIYRPKIADLGSIVS